MVATDRCFSVDFTPGYFVIDVYVALGVLGVDGDAVVLILYVVGNFVG